VGEGAIVGPFGLRREKTARQLPCPEMVANAVATNTPTRTGRIGAGAIFKIFGLFAFHAAPLDDNFQIVGYGFPLKVARRRFCEAGSGLPNVLDCDSFEMDIIIVVLNWRAYYQRCDADSQG